MEFSDKKFILNEHIYNVKQTKIQDIQEILKLQKKIYKNDHGWFIHTYHQELKRKNNLSLNIYDKDKLIGFISFNFINDTCHILNIMIDPDYRNQGIASHMIDIAINISKNKGLKSVKLNVKSNNKDAYTLYISNGFKDVQLVQNMYGNGQDGIIMKKTF